MNRYENAKNQILTFLDQCKISSVKINGVDYSLSKDIPKDIEIESFYINKKYLPLFKKDEDFIFDNFIENKEGLVRRNNGKYLTVNLTFHSRYRYVVRHLLILLSYKQCLNKPNIDRFQPILDCIIGQKEQILKMSTGDQLYNFLVNVVIEKEKELNECIYDMLRCGRNVKENTFSNKLKRRKKYYANSDYYACYPFLLVYDVKNTTIITIEIFELNNIGSPTRDVRLFLNKHSDCMDSLLNNLKIYLRDL